MPRCLLSRVVVAGLIALVGCSRTPARIHPPSIDASAAGAAAIERFDQNGDGVVGGEELEQAPALQAAIENLDTDGDGAVSAEEVAARVRAWQASRIGIMSTSCRVTLDGEPLAGATVVYDPAPFLGDEIKPATGKTDKNGYAALTIAEEDRQDPNVPGAHCGLYRVRISKQESGSEPIPARYNTDTTLGVEVAPDAEAVEAGMQFELTRD